MFRDRLKTIAIVLFFISYNILSAELQIQLKVLNDATKISVETDEFPVYYAYIKAFSDGNFVVLDKNQVVVVQDNIPRRPFEVTAPDGLNWQKVSWYGAASEFPSVEVYAAKNGEAAMTKGALTDKGMNVLVFKDDVYNELFELNFGTVNPGGNTYRMIQMNIARSILVDGIEQPVMIDSVVAPKPFSYQWLGASINQKEPPVKMEPGFVYRFFGFFTPPDNNYYRDKITVYFNGKSSETLDIWGNHFDIPTPTLLQLIQPNGGQLLAPCTEYEIKWKGHVKGLPTRVDYTTNGGATWNLITYSFDSSYIWKVPLEPTAKAKVRVTQEFNKNSVYGLEKDYSPIGKIVYNKSGYNILAANDAGFVREWEIYTKASSEKYVFATNLNYPGVKTKAIGIEYFDNDSNFAVAANYVSQGRVNRGEIAFFRRDNYSPYKTIQIPDKYIAKEMFINSARTQLILTPVTGSKLLIFDINTGSLINSVDLGKPISAFTFSRTNNEAAVAFYDSEILLLDGTDFTQKKSFYFSNLPVVIRLALSPNGKYIGIACRAPVWQSSFRSNRTENHVLDIASGLIVRTNRNSASDALGIEFNPISSSLLIGSEAQPQVAIWDLTGDEYISSLDGHTNVMTDFKVAPDGHSIVTCAAAPDNLLVRFFTYPEHDESEHFFEIGEPLYSLDSIEIEPKFISTRNEIDFNTKLCNTGKVPIILENSFFRFGAHFRLKENNYPDTLMPGECKNIPLVYNPIDTGAIYDVLGFNSCLGLIEIPIRSRSLPRNISFFSNPYDFGEKCVWQLLEKDILYIKNNDPVPLKINDIFLEKSINSSFKIVSNVRDTIIPPGGTLTIKAAFVPSKLEENLDNVLLYHSDQAILVEKSVFKGWGIGTNLDISHNNLRFIPELPERTIKIRNLNNNSVTIDSYKFTPEGSYSVIGQFPITMKPQEEIELHIRWNTGTDDAVLNITATPCVATLGITCGIYSSLAYIKAGNVEADPRGVASIPIESSISETLPYKGVRFLEAEFSINPRIFLPEKVTTPYGTAELIKNIVADGKRIMGVRINGDFPANGTIGHIEGIAGLAETDTSSIDISGNSKFFGSNTTVTFNSGFFRLINLCGDRRVIQPDANIVIKSIIPNPASNSFGLLFNSLNSNASSVEIYDFFGGRVLEIKGIGTIKGDNQLNVNVSELKTGTYKLVIRQGTDICSENFVIIR